MSNQNDTNIKNPQGNSNLGLEHSGNFQNDLVRAGFEYGVQSRQAKARNRGTEIEQKQNDQGVLGDTMDAFQHGAAQTVSGDLETIHQLSGSETAGKWADGFNAVAKKQIEEDMSASGRDSFQKPFFEEDANGYIQPGEGLTDPYSWLLQGASLTGQIATTATPAKATISVGARVAARAVAKNELNDQIRKGVKKEIAEKIAKEKGKEVLASSKNGLPSTMAYTAFGTAAANGMAGQSVKDEILSMTAEEQDESNTFRTLYYELDEKFPNKTVREKRQIALRTLAERGSAEVQRQPELIATNVASEFVTGRFVDGLFSGLGNSSRIVNSIKGGTSQFAAEGAQGSVEQYASNKAIDEVGAREIDNPWDGALVAGLNEGVIGGGIGSVGGLVGKPTTTESSAKETQSEASDGADPEMAPEEQEAQDQQNEASASQEPEQSLEDLVEQIKSERSDYRGIDDDIAAAEKMEFFEEAVRLKAAKRNFQKAMDYANQGNQEAADRFRQRGLAIYQDVMEEAAPQYKGGLPAEYVATGEVIESMPLPNVTEEREGVVIDNGTPGVTDQQVRNTINMPAQSDEQVYGNRNNGIDGVPTKVGRMDSNTQPKTKEGEGIEYERVDVSQPEKPSFELADYDENAIDFSEEAPSRIDELADRVLAATEQEADRKRDRKLPEGLKDEPRLLRAPFRQRLALTKEQLKALRDRNSSKEPDPRSDDLLEAIAKLGGINTADAVAEGLDKADTKAVNGERFKKAFKANGGLSFDAMAEALSQYGYMPADYTKSELLDKVLNSLQGNDEYSLYRDYDSNPYADWYQDAPEYIQAMGTRGVAIALDKALKGKPLGDRQARAVKHVLDLESSERQERYEGAIKPYREKVKKLRQLLKQGYSEAEAREIANLATQGADVQTESDAAASIANEAFAEGDLSPDELADLIQVVDGDPVAMGIYLEEVANGNKNVLNQGSTLESILGIDNGQNSERVQRSGSNSQRESETKLRSSSRDDGEGRGQDERAASTEDGPILTQYTEEELAQREREQAKASAEKEKQEKKQADKLKADQDADQFSLTGSNLEADQAAAAGQSDLLSSSPVDTNPTEAQKQAGNYKKRHIRFHGLEISIENPAGSTRSGKDENGKEWSNEIYHDYGDIKGTKGADGDNIDVFMGDNLTGKKVFVVNQTHADGKFDEHKVMLGFNSKEAAEKGYLSNYESGWKNYSDIVETDIDGFKHWLEEGNHKTQFSEALKTADQKPKSWDRTSKKVWIANDGQIITNESFGSGGKQIKNYFVYADKYNRDKGVNYASGSSLSEAKSKALSLEDALEQSLRDPKIEPKSGKKSKKAEAAPQKAYKNTNNAKKEEVGSAIKEQSDLYFGYEREKTNLQDQQRDTRINEQTPAAGRGETIDLFSPSPKDKRQDYSDLFGTVVRSAPVSEIKVGKDIINTASDLAHIAAPIRKDAQETFLAFVTDQKGKVLRAIRHSKGLKDSASVDPLIIIAEAASIEGAAAVHFAHNHPTGNPAPSRSDKVITEKIASLLDGTGIELGYHAVIGEKTWQHVDNDFRTDIDSGAQPIRPMPRKKSIAITERKFTTRDTLGPAIESPTTAIRVTENHDNALFLLNNKNAPVGIIPLTVSEMGELREGNRVNRILSAIDKSNANSAIIKAKGKTQDVIDSINNLSKMLSRFDEMRVLDGIVETPDNKTTSLAQTGHLNQTGGAFASLKEDPDINIVKGMLAAIGENLDSNPAKERDFYLGHQKQVKSWISGTEKELGINVEVVPTANDLPLKTIVNLSARGYLPYVKGVYEDGKMYLVANRIADESEAIQTTIHEALGHHGVMSYLGKELEPTIKQIYKGLGRKAFERLAADDAYDLDLNTEEGKRTAVLEYIALMSETGRKPRLVERVIAAIRRAIRKVFPSSRIAQWTPIDIVDLIERSRVSMQRGTHGNSARGVLGALRLGDATKANLSRFVDDTLAEKIKPESIHTIKAMPSVLRMLGLDDGSINISASVVRKAINKSEWNPSKYKLTNDSKHDLNKDGLMKAIEGLYEPVAIFESETSSGALVILTEAIDVKGNPVVVALHAHQDSAGLTVYDIASVHGRRGKVGLVQGWIDKGLSRFLDKNKVRSWPSKTQLQLLRAEPPMANQGASPKPQSARKLDLRFAKNRDGLKILTKKDLVKFNEGGDTLARIETKAPTSTFFEDLTDDQASLLDKIGRPTVREKATHKLRTMVDRWRTKVRQGLVDRYAALMEMDKKLLGDDVLTEDKIGSSAWVRARMSNVASGAMSAMMNTGRIFLDREGVIDVRKDTKGLIDVLRQLGQSSEIERFMGWIAANRAEKLMEQGRENLFTQDEIKAGIKLDQGTMEDGRDRGELYAKVLKEFEGYREDVLSIADEAGLLQKGMEPLEALEAMAKKYKIGLGKLKVIRRLKRDPDGNEDVDIKEMNEEKIGVLSADLEAELIEALGEAEYTEESERLMTDQRELWMNEFYVPFYRALEDIDDQKGVITMGGGLSRQQAYKQLKGGSQELNDLLQNTIMNFHHLIDASMKNIAAKQAIDNAVSLGVAIQSSQEAAGKNGTFILENGIKTWYSVEDPLVLAAITSLGHTGFNGVAMNIMRKFKRVFTNFTTSSPQFMAANLIRDSLQAISTSDLSKNAGKNVYKGIRAYKDDYEKARLNASGGAFSFGHVYGEDSDAIKWQMDQELKKGKIIKTPGDVRHIINAAWDKWQGVGNVLENANRASAYKQNENKSRLYAAYQARDIMDFSAHGAWPAIRVLIDIVPFLNARLQGLDKLWREGIKPNAKAVRSAMGMGDISLSEKKAAQRFSSVVGALTAATIALYMYNKDDEEYRKLPEWLKDTYWVVRLGDWNGYIPKPFEVGAMATMAERFTEQMVDDKATGDLFAERLGHMLTDTFSFSPIPQMFQPAIDVYSNRDSFTDRDIETMGMERLSQSLRFTDRTTEGAKVASQLLENTIGSVAGKDSRLVMSPVQIDYLVRNYLGWVGASVLSSSDIIAKSAMGKTEPEKHWYEYQPIKRFVSNNRNPKYTKQQGLFYDQLRDINRIYSDINEYREMGQYEEALEMYKNNKDKLRYRKMFNRIQRKLAALNARIKSVNTRDISAELKRREIDRLKEMKNRIVATLEGYIAKIKTL